MSEVKTATAPAAQGTGLDPKISGLISWVFGATIFVPLILFVIEKDKFAKFHAFESLIWSIFATVVVWGGSFVLSITIVGVCCIPLLFALYLVNFYGAYMAYKGEMWKLPVIGDMAEQQAGK